MRTETNVHDVVSAEIFDVPLGHNLIDGELTYTKDIHIKMRNGSEIVFFCYMGPVKDAKTGV
jgi:hypothetical protein